jgi:very-short-patch-repair endonuclease
MKSYLVIFEDCKNKKGLRFDFYLYDENTIIEYDGEHHFIENKYFGNTNLEYVRKNDEIKNKYCLLNSIKLVKIPYYDYNNIESILNSVI